MQWQPSTNHRPVRFDCSGTVLVRVHIKTNSHVVKQYYKFLYAYEQALAEKHQGKRRPKATRTRRAIEKRLKENNGNLELAVIDYLTTAVTKKETTDGFEFLMSTDQAELTAEHLVKSNPSYFSEVAVAAAIKKLDNWAPSRDDE